MDVSGNLFIADFYNNCIRKVDTNGIITTVAGNGEWGYSGDGGPATNATLDEPYGVAVDSSGNLFISDSSNDRIRKMDTNGVITTVAGKDTWGYSGDGGPATNATLNLPSGMALDSIGNLFIADLGNERIRKVALYASYPTLTLNNVSLDNIGSYSVIITGPSGSVTSSVVTLTVLSPPIIMSQPRSIITSNGVTVSFNVSVVGTAPLSIQWQINGLDLTDGSKLSGSTTTNLLLNNITTNDAGGYTVIITNAWGSVTSTVANLAVMTPAWPSNQTVMLGSVATFSVTVAGNGPYTYQWQLNGTNLLTGIITTVAGNGSAGHSGDGGPATDASLFYPCGLALDASGNLLIADENNNRIRKIDTYGIITTVAGNGTNGYSGDGNQATNASLYNPCGLAFDASGNLFIADFNNSRIRKVDTNGVITTVAGKGSSSYSGDGGPATNAGLSPVSMLFDIYGNLFIADYANNRIRKVDINGIITTVAGNGSGSYSGDGGAPANASLFHPQGVAMDAFGNLFIADYGNNCIRKFAFANYPTLTLNNVYPANAGNYSVIITGPGGSVTSSIVTLTVTVPPPVISQTVINPNHSVTLQLLTAPYLSSRILAATNLGSAVWLPIYTNVAGANGVWQFTDINTAGRPVKFYRISTP